MSKKTYFSCLILSSISFISLHAMEQFPEIKDGINKLNTAGWMPLHSAIALGSNDTVSELLELGAHAQARTTEKKTPLYLCAEFNMPEKAQLLLAKNVSTESSDDYGRTALHICCKKGHVDVIEPLIMHNACLGVPDISGNDPIAYALAYKDYSDPSVILAIQKALQKKHAGERPPEQFPLHKACQSAACDEIENLILAGKSTDEFDAAGNTAWHYASANANSNVLKTLIAAIKKTAKKERLPLQENLATSMPAASLPVQSLQ